MHSVQERVAEILGAHPEVQGEYANLFLICLEVRRAGNYQQRQMLYIRKGEADLEAKKEYSPEVMREVHAIVNLLPGLLEEDVTCLRLFLESKREQASDSLNPLSRVVELLKFFNPVNCARA